MSAVETFEANLGASGNIDSGELLMIGGDACFSVGLKFQAAKLAVINNIAAVANPTNGCNCRVCLELLVSTLLESAFNSDSRFVSHSARGVIAWCDALISASIC